ncbi:hypothetical protein PHLCEN_2v3194 [Hermanssonia centrifuga]|uniref:Uncharacterized protein n=1 Tax=Hermanssonia centrifuga TaxID=98765 RepID=A0A2R6R0V6_9APHY|nr:hypothetical protein PHLCEN_2v3194 [Hermanssonia centrifuga]
MTTAQSTTLLPCDNKTHCFDKEDVRDRYYNSKRKPPWDICKELICSNHYTFPHYTSHKDNTWAKPTDPDQISRIIEYHKLSEKRRAEVEEELAQRVQSSRPSTTVAQPTPRPSQIPIARSASGSGTPTQQPIAQQQQPPPPPNPPSPPPPTTVVPMAAQNPSLSDVSKAFLAVPELRNNGTNFELWRARVKAATHTIENEAILTTPHTDANFDGIVAAAIQGKLQNNLFMLVNTLTTCKGIMDSLITQFGQTTAVVTADAERQLFSMKCQSDSHIMKHLDDLELQYNHLTELVRKIDEKTYINIIITSLPSSYRPTINALSTSIDTQNRISAVLGTNYVSVVLTSTQVISSVRAESLSR